MRFLTARPGSSRPILLLALLVCLLSAVPARAGADPAPSTPTKATTVAPEQKVLVLEDWDYTALSKQQLITDVIVFIMWVDLNLAGHKVAPRTTSTTGTGTGTGTGTMTVDPGLVSRRIYGVLFLEYVYDLNVLGQLSQAQLDGLVFGEFFLNQLFVIPGLTGTTG